MKEENAYQLTKFLAEEKPEVVLINECGKYKKNIERVEEEYEIIQNGTKICAIVRREVAANQIARSSWNEFAMALKLTTNKKSVIVVNTYRPPGNVLAFDLIRSLIMELDDMYRDTPIVVFKDLNVKRDAVTRKVMLENRGFKAIFETHPDAYTRKEEVLQILKKSYLDYFLTKNLRDTKLELCEPIGNSDHRTLKLIVCDDNMRICRRRIMVFPFRKLFKDLKSIVERLKTAMTQESVDTSVIELIRKLGEEYGPQPRRLRSKFRTIEQIETMTWLEKRKHLKNMSKESFTTFMEKVGESVGKKNVKEFYLRMRFYTDLNKNTAPLTNIETLDENGVTVSSYDSKIINEEVSKKYRTLFGCKGTKVMTEYLSNSFRQYDEQDIKSALYALDLSKATSWDMIPGKAFAVLKSDADFVRGLRDLMNKLVAMKSIPDEIGTGRLFCLNKEASKPGNVDSIRPITISSFITKIFERPLLAEIKKAKLNQAQVGFTERMGTEVNLLKLKTTVHELKYRNYNRKKKLSKIYLLFIDFKAAFDTVDHAILVEKMRSKGIDESVINNLTMILNSSKVSADKSEVININKGVAQGKLCSPIEFISSLMTS